MHPRTKARLEAVTIPDNRPVLVVDADEVILLFAQDFDAWLRPQGIWFDYNLYDYSAALKDRDGREIGLTLGNELVQRFNIEGTRHHTAAPGAIDALLQLGRTHTILVLTNVPMQCLDCLLYTSPSPRDQRGSRMPSSA